MSDESIKNQIIEKWDEIISFMRDSYGITTVSYNTWIKPLVVVDANATTVTIAVEEKYGTNGVNHIIKQYKIFLQTSIAEILGQEYDIDFILPSQKGSDNIDNPEKRAVLANLNDNYTFDTFVVGSNNMVAHAAAAAVADDPGGAYNPLFIYGGVGLGKTHLIQAIAHEIIERDKTKKVLFITGEKFTNELIQSIRDKTGDVFREKYRSVDVLIVDDIQFIIGKGSVQEEFFWTFNTLYENRKQIVLSSDVSPSKMTALEDRLTSRFDMGVTAEISHPDYEMRLAIIKQKAEEKALEGKIDNSILEYIAENVTSNVRILASALDKVIALSRLKKKEITMDLVQEATNSIIDVNAERVLTVNSIVGIVAEYFTIPLTSIFSKNKEAKVAYPRHIAIYLCKKYLSLSYVEIGKAFKRDHSTIMSSCKRIEKDIKDDPSLASTIDLLVKKININ